MPVVLAVKVPEPNAVLVSTDPAPLPIDSWLIVASLANANVVPSNVMFAEPANTPLLLNWTCVSSPPGTTAGFGVCQTAAVSDVAVNT
jgi:hypothetical protein